MTTSSRTHRIVLCGLFTALIAIGAFIQIPVPYLDYFTLQFLFVILAGMLLGARWGAAAVGAYVALGLAGLPIFAAGGGLQYVLRPSFGYLLGFIVTAWLVGVLGARTNATRFTQLLPIALTGMVVTYIIGFAYKYIILNTYLGQPTPLVVVLLSAFPLDMPGDTVLCILASGLAVRLRTALNREGLL